MTTVTNSGKPLCIVAADVIARLVFLNQEDVTMEFVEPFFAEV